MFPSVSYRSRVAILLVALAFALFLSFSQEIFILIILYILYKEKRKRATLRMAPNICRFSSAGNIEAEIEAEKKVALALFLIKYRFPTNR